jgi:hypothetical protein
MSIDDSDKAVTQLLGSSKLRDKKTGEFLKVYSINLQNDYIRIQVEKHDDAKLILHKSGVGVAAGVTLTPILFLKQVTGFEPEYGEPVPIGQDIPVDIFQQRLLVRPLTMKVTAVRTTVSFQVAHESGDSKILIDVLPVRR